ncbi:helix-turn-helix domain-containing protein [Nonomuraea sp. NPDC005650]|uniref:helix-turn-helix domain-containing protein n=1 Tax=Nonomuraea sp. NPDC005650 TaxID=3157045 RepID=UPI0033B03EA1
MKHLLLRLSELDARAGDELRVISFFDALLQNGTDLDRLLIEAARLAECPVGVSVPGLGVHRRVSADGGTPDGPADPDARKLGLANGGEVWIERRGPAYPIDAMLIERFAIACAAVLGKRDPGPAFGDPALVELVLSSAVDEAGRCRALKLLGLRPDRPVQVFAVAGDASGLGGRAARLGELHGVVVSGPPWPDALASTSSRAGVSPRVPSASAARAWHQARTALRFAGPGELWGRVVHWDRLGGFALLAEHLPYEAVGGSPDVAALDRLAEGANGESVLATLDVFAASDSIRRTAARLYIHRTSVAARLARAESELGFPVQSAQGRARLTLALTLRRLGEHPSAGEIRRGT